MKASITIPKKPYSVNAMYYRDGRRKKREAVQWETSIIDYFRDKETQEQLTKIREAFNPKEHVVHVALRFYFPYDMLIAKGGYLSGRAFDLSNMEKPLIDVIFLEKNSTKACKNLEIDDKYISRVRSDKLPSIEHRIEVDIELKPIQPLLDEAASISESLKV